VIGDGKLFDTMDINDKDKATLIKQKVNLDDNRKDLTYMELIYGA
jgi:hypothetical protein